MTVTLTNRLLMSKPDNAELISVALLNANWDKADAEFIPAAMMIANVNQTLTTGVVTTVAYNVANFDSYAARSEGAMVNLSTDTITIRKTGLYWVSAACAFAPNATGNRRLEIVKNGTSLITTQRSQVSAGGSEGLHIGEPISLAANDAVTAKGFQNSGGNLDMTNLGFTDGCSLAVIWLGSLV